MKFLLWILVLFTYVISSSSFGNHSLEKILNGIGMKIKQAPFFVHIAKNDKLFCGGSILSKLVVLTAAHCFDNYTVKNVYKIFHSSDVALHGSSILMKNFKMHPQYNGLSEHGYDVAVVQLLDPLPFKPNLCQPIRLVTQSFKSIKLNDQVLVLGMGVSTPQGHMSKNLLGLKLPKISDKNCKQFVEASSGEWNDNYPTQICFGRISVSGHDTCQGDSGGPVVYKNMQVGIVSWGIGCGTGTPGVYTNIRVLIPWIQKEARIFDPVIAKKVNG